tara:strand:+ start:12636 stop:13085 length:450 start_codon:yes stop_codon:yes gene_type:complete
MKCKATRTKSKGQCTKNAMYGVLCDVHARQLVGTPMGFQYNRLLRRNFPDLSQQELDQSELEHSLANGRTFIQRKTNPHSYSSSVLKFIRQENEVSAEQIVNYVRKLSSYDMSAPKIGKITGELIKKNLITRFRTTRDGKSVTLYRSID